MNTPIPPLSVPSVLATSSVFPDAILTWVCPLLVAFLLELASIPTTWLLYKSLACAVVNLAVTFELTFVIRRWPKNLWK